MGSVYEGILRIGGGVRAPDTSLFDVLTMEVMKPRKMPSKTLVGQWSHRQGTNRVMILWVCKWDRDERNESMRDIF